MKKGSTREKVNLPIEDIYNLSPMQEHMYRLRGRVDVYMQQMDCYLSGQLDIQVFRRAWEQVFARHAAFRTGFFSEGLSRPVQVVFRNIEPPWIVRDHSGHSPSKQHDIGREILKVERAAFFDLSRPPLVRFSVIRLGNALHRLIVTFHHIVLDGWSWPLIMEELFGYYEGFRTGQHVTAELPRPYGDYIVWLERERDVECKSFWHGYLKGFKNVSPLRSGMGAGFETASPLCAVEEELAFPETLGKQLVQLAKQHTVSLNSLFQAAWGILLRKYSSVNDIVFATVVSGRTAELSGIEKMVGLFLNVLPVRLLVSPELTLTEWIRKVFDQQMAAYPYQSVSLHQIEEWSGTTEIDELCESVLVFENYPKASTWWKEVSDLKISKLRASGRTESPLTLDIYRNPDLTVKISCSSVHFDQRNVKRLIGQFREILWQMVSSSEQTISCLI